MVTSFFEKEMESYDNENLLFNIYHMIWLLIDSPALPETGTSILYDKLKIPLYWAETIGFKYRMKPSFLQKLKASLLHKKASFSEKLMVSYGTEMFVASKVPWNVTVENSKKTVYSY